MRVRRRLTVIVAALAAALPGAAAVTAVPAHAATLPSPVLVAPAPASVQSHNPVLTWSAVAGAVRYAVQVATDAGFSAKVYDVTTYDTSATPPSELPLGTIYWRVAGIDRAGGTGDWAQSSFAREWADAPTLSGPAEDSTLHYPDDPPVLAWQPLPGAASYQVQIDDSDDFISPQQFTTANTSYVTTGNQTIGQSWSWRVRGVSATGGLYSAWSSVRHYTIDWPAIPQLLAPTGSAPVTDVRLRWSPVPGAAAYEVQVNPNQDFTNNMTVDATVKGTEYSPVVTLDNDAYYWRVRAVDSTGAQRNYGMWSAVSPVTGLPQDFVRQWLDRPTLQQPADEDAQVAVPTFTWSAVPHASRYEIQFDIDPGFVGLVPSDLTTHTTFTPYTNYQNGETTHFQPRPGQVTYWRVRAIDEPYPSGVKGLWSDVHWFVYRPQMVTLTGPADGATVQAPVLTWDPATGASKYRVVIKNADGSLAKQADTVSTSYTPETALDPAKGPFSWNVERLDADNNGVVPAPDSDRHFTLTAVTSTAGQATPVTPADGAHSVYSPAMSWTPVTGAAKYQVWYGLAGSDVAQKLGPQVAYPAYTFTGTVPPPGDYFFYVSAYDKSGVELTSSYPRGWFTVDRLQWDNGPIPVSYLSPQRCTPDVTCVPEPVTPLLRWQPIAAATTYIVYLSPDNNFTNNGLRAWRTSTPEFVPMAAIKDSQAGQAWYWFVRPCKYQDSGCAEFDNATFPTAWAFKKQTAPVTLVSPDDGAQVTAQVTLRWQDYLASQGTGFAAEDARTYHLQVSTTTDFSATIDDVYTDATSYTPYAHTYPEGPLYWRVAATDGSNNPLTWSATRRLLYRSDPLTAVTPADGARVSGLATFAWQPQPYAAGYELEVYRNGDLRFTSTNRVVDQRTTEAAWSPTSALPSGSYAWRVRRLDADGRPGPWSPARADNLLYGRTFALSLGAPALSAPAAGAGVHNGHVLFTWGAVTGAASYAVDVSTSPAFTSTVESVNTVMTAWAPTRHYGDGSYYWRVRVLNASGQTMSTSAYRSFGVDDTAPTVTAKSPTSAAAVTGAFHVTFSEPVHGVNASTMRVRIASTTTYLAGTVSAGSTWAGWRPATPLTPGQRYTVSLSGGITDAAGNHLAPYAWTVRATTLVENTSPALHELWDRDTSTHASGGGYLASPSGGASVRFTFTGSNVAVYGVRAPNGGYATVYLDGVKKATAGFHAASCKWGVRVWSVTGLAGRAHTLRLVATGTHPSGATGSYVYVDRFAVGSVTTQETGGAVLTGFRRTGTSSAHGGSYDLEQFVAAGDNGGRPCFRLTFRGTGISWSATRLPSAGTAGVWLDGHYRATVDLYSATSRYQQTVYWTSALTDRVHTLGVCASGIHAAASHGTWVTTDAFTIR